MRARSRVGEIERLACSASARSADWRFGRDRQLTAAERTRRAGRSRTLAGIEGIAPAPALRRRNALWRSRWFHDDRRLSGALRVIPRLGRWLPIGRVRLHRRSRGDVGLGDSGLTAGGGWRATLQRPQAIFELPVAVLQLLVLAGELPQLILKLLNSHFRVIGLRRYLRGQRQHRGDCRGVRNSMKSGRHLALTT